MADLPVPAAHVPPPSRRLGWTFPALVFGFAVVGACLLVPQIDENRMVRHEVEHLRAEYVRVEEQIRVNDEFLAQVSVDPTLLARLAQRQLRLVPTGADTLQLTNMSGSDTRSPFQLVSVPPPEVKEAPAPVGGILLEVFRHGRKRLYLLGGALLLIAAALVLDGPRRASR